MTLADIPKKRLITQHLSSNNAETVKELVTWMGAIQAQDYAMVKWAVGIRLPGTTNSLVERAIDQGEIIRTHLLRPTWHLVSADDLRWMLELTAPHIKSLLKSRHRELEITDAVLRESNSLIIKALRDGNHLSREELISIFEKNKIPTGDNRAYHLFLCAELDGIICSGTIKNKKPTYALLEDRVPEIKPVSRVEALAKLAGKYFSSHGPATIHDFVWWSGLPVTDARKALEMLKPALVSETSGTETYWLYARLPVSGQTGSSVYMLPAYDEFLISYKDRSASLPSHLTKRTFSSNGVFHPVIIVDGKVKGLWKRTLKNNKVLVETQFFEKPDKSTLKQVELSIQSYTSFQEK